MDKDLSKGARIMLHEALPTCSVCGRSIDGHVVRFIASQPAPEDVPIESLELVRAAQVKDIERVLKMQSWEPLSPDIDAVLIRCVDGRTSLATIWSPFALGPRCEIISQALLEDFKEERLFDASAVVI